MTQYNEDAPEESVQLDQEEFHRTLETDGDMVDPLDQGIQPPDRWSAAEGFGNTVEEQREGETLDMRIAQEEPDVGVEEEEPLAQTIDSDTTAEDVIEPDLDVLDDSEVGDERAGRLTATSGGEGMGVQDEEDELLATDVGIDHAGAGAEEAAMHVVDDEDVVTLDDDPEV
jgi:hypothetical protein